MGSLYAAQAYNNAWANHRLITACRQLPADQLSQDRQGFFGSIIATLNHILIVDWFYVSALEGRCMGQSAFVDEIPHPGIAELALQQRQIDERFIRLCEAPTAELEGRKIELLRRGSIQIERFDRTFLHLIQHQIHHRGQVHGMLSSTDVPPPQLDEFYMAWDADRQLRAPDFSKLGFFEDKIWG
ncbi:DinB family protein [Yoonia sp. BS5-3]|uniref:DinB family protein n=1 Tax=Yoonia phaeophyticola TaxID=3137369 RepID=A0ABZ2V2T6_9RHOB